MVERRETPFFQTVVNSFGPGTIAGFWLPPREAWGQSQHTQEGEAEWSKSPDDTVCKLTRGQFEVGFLLFAGNSILTDPPTNHSVL